MEYKIYNDVIIQIDKQDYDLVSKYNWYHSKTGGVTVRGNRNFKLGRLLLGLQPGDNNLAVHKDGDEKNNKRSNLVIGDKRRAAMVPVVLPSKLGLRNINYYPKRKGQAKYCFEVHLNEWTAGGSRKKRCRWFITEDQAIRERNKWYVDQGYEIPNDRGKDRAIRG